MYAGTRDEPIALGDRNWASAEAPVDVIDFWQAMPTIWLRPSNGGPVVRRKEG